MAHASLWRQYAGKIDLMLACSCPPNLPEPTYHFPDGTQVANKQFGSIFVNFFRQIALRVFVDTTAQQASWLGVPYLGSTACGNFRSRVPNPLGSFGGLFLFAGLIRYLPQLRKVELSASMVEAGRIVAADGRLLASLHNEQGEAFALARVAIPAERPQPRTRQPRPPVPRLTYFMSDRMLTMLSRGTYAGRNANHQR